MSVTSKIYEWLVCPHRLVWLGRRAAKRAEVAILDVGCGNHSPRITKRYFPACTYHGLYTERWNLDDRDDECMDKVFDVDLEVLEQLARVPDEAYDIVICSHILEHLEDPVSTAVTLARKLRAGGCMYIETPSRRSLRLPRTSDGWLRIKGCLNFHDDETHKCLVDLSGVAVHLREAGYEVSRVRTARLWRKVILLPFYIFATRLVKGFIPASVFWDVTGFAQYLHVYHSEPCRSV